MDLLNLGEFAGGALQEKANGAMQKVLENMQDPNTPYKVKRGITIKIGFVQNEDRDDVMVEMSVETKLAPSSPVHTMMSIGRDLENGEVYAEEYGKQIKEAQRANSQMDRERKSVYAGRKSTADRRGHC